MGYFLELPDFCITSSSYARLRQENGYGVDVIIIFLLNTKVHSNVAKSSDLDVSGVFLVITTMPLLDHSLSISLAPN